MKHPWATDLAEFFRDANKLKKNYLDMGQNSIDENELARVFAGYDEILAAGNELENIRQEKQNLINDLTKSKQSLQQVEVQRMNIEKRLVDLEQK